jgi:amino acid adenylation domain-containing protein
MNIVDTFHQCVRRFPERPALRDSRRELTYAELDAAASGLAAELMAQGVRPGDIVGVHMRRSADSIVALLAVLQAGAAYLATDTRYPPERIRLMLRDADVRVVITQRDLATGLPDDLIAVLGDQDYPPNRVTVPVDGEDLAYVAYTSGSTGRPKGVMVPHRAVARLVIGADFIDIEPDDVLVHLAPIAFDASTLEIWGALLNGARVAVAPEGDLSLRELTGFVRTAGATILWLTAGLFHQVVDFGLSDLTGLRYLLAGGDVLSVGHVNRALEALPNTVLVNGYGPTENTTFTCCHQVRDAVTAQSVPIGTPISGTSITVLDEHLQPADVGELFTGGLGLARGYLGQPAATAARFLPDPDAVGGRIYRTGDLVRHNGHGLEFLGRGDQQVKIRGFRVEVGEIDAAFQDLPEVAQHCVLVRTAPAGDRSLQAAVVLTPDHRHASLANLRRSLRDTLPSYAVPSVITVVDALPLTVNGKVDRAALEEQFAAGRPDLMSEYRAPSTPAEEAVVELWSDHLGVHGIGVDDDFFELGGHSLLGMRIIGDLHQMFGVELSPRDFYLAPTPAGMAEALTREGAPVSGACEVPA